MKRITLLTDENSGPVVQSTLAAIKKKFGKVTNMLRAMVHSPVTYEAFTALSECCEKTSLPSKLRHQIALLVAELNGCSYCVAAHVHIAKFAKLTDQEIIDARRGMASDPRSQLILGFCKAVVEQRGSVSDEEMQNIKDQGISDKELCELILVISYNNFTNYFNKIADPELDFPPISAQD